MGLEAVLVATSIGGQAGSFLSSKKAAKAMKNRNAVQARMDQLEVDRKIQDQLSRARAIRSRTINIAEQTGTEGSSAVASASGAIESSALDNASFLRSGLLASQEMNRLGNVASEAQGDAAVFGAVAGVADLFASATGAYSKVFGEDVKPPVPGVKATGEYGKGLGVLKQ